MSHQVNGNAHAGPAEDNEQYLTAPYHYIRDHPGKLVSFLDFLLNSVIFCNFYNFRHHFELKLSFSTAISYSFVDFCKIL